jgi:prepilin-type N-terminal cleavage/methylation domain-containing protein
MKRARQESRRRNAQGESARAAARGFTILELIMVLAVGSILMAAAIPQVRSQVFRYRLHGAVASAVWAIQSTRYQALMKGYAYQVVFDQSANSYQIQSAPDNVTFSNLGGAVPMSGSPTVLDADTTLRFRPNGLVTNEVGNLNFTITYQGLCQTVSVSNYANITLSVIGPSCS